MRKKAGFCEEYIVGYYGCVVNAPEGVTKIRNSSTNKAFGISTNAIFGEGRLNGLKQVGVEFTIFDKIGSNPTKPVVEEVCGVANLKMSPSFS